MTVAGHVKQVLALIAAVMAGFVVGIGTGISMAFSVPLGNAPGWVSAAEFIGWTATVGTALAAIGWVYIDYKYVEKA